MHSGYHKGAWTLGRGTTERLLPSKGGGTMTAMAAVAALALTATVMALTATAMALGKWVPGALRRYYNKGQQLWRSVSGP